MGAEPVEPQMNAGERRCGSEDVKTQGLTHDEECTAEARRTRRIWRVESHPTRFSAGLFRCRSIVWPGPGVGLDGLVVRIKVRLRQNQGGDPPGYFRDILRFLNLQPTAENGLLPVAQPLLDDLIAADGVLSHRLWHVRPIRLLVQISSSVSSTRT